MMATIYLTMASASCMLAHAQRMLREECCGVLAGQAGTISRVFPAKNVATQPATAYEIAPEELFGLMREIRGARLELLGIYHSHPKGDNIPSERDIERAYYPDVAYIIISPRSMQKALRAFSIRDGHAVELEIQLV